MYNHTGRDLVRSSLLGTWSYKFMMDTVVFVACPGGLSSMYTLNRLCSVEELENSRPWSPTPTHV